MKKNLTEMVFILDRSGSMAGLEADTIGGFNSMIEKQKSSAPADGSRTTSSWRTPTPTPIISPSHRTAQPMRTTMTRASPI